MGVKGVLTSKMREAAKGIRAPGRENGPTLANMGEPRARKAKLRDETRQYTVEAVDLAEWVSGESRFNAVEIVYDNAEDAFVVTLSSAKQAEQPRITKRDAFVDRDTEARLTSGPQVSDDDAGDMGTADAVPAIASRGERDRLRKHVRSRREILIEAQKQGKPAPAARITHRETDEDDPVPSALPDHINR